MRIFQIVSPVDYLWYEVPPVVLHNPYDVEVINPSHSWHMPGVRCDVCGRAWGSTLCLPAIDVSGYTGENMLRGGGSISVDRFRALTVDLREYLGSKVSQDVPILPGMRFGPISGAVRGKTAGDFLYSGQDLMIGRESMEKLVRSGVRGITAVCADLHIRKGARVNSLPEFMNLHVEPLARICDTSLTRQGDECGNCSFPGKVELRRKAPIRFASVPDGVDVFRAVELYQEFFVSEAFKEVALQLGLTNLKLLEVSERVEV